MKDVKKQCAEGRHSWAPVMVDGVWNGTTIHCKHCACKGHAEDLKQSEVEKLRATARNLREKYRALAAAVVDDSAIKAEQEQPAD